MPGRFVTFEGGEGAGKSTQARLLAREIERRGVSVVLTREPGGTPGAEAIRTLLLHADGEGWTPAAEALLFAAARADHVDRLIRPALQEGRWVVCDRFLDSSRAYQAGPDTLDDAAIQALHRIGSAGLLPDATVLIELDAAQAAIRLAMRDGDASDRIGGRPRAYHAAVAERFAAIAAREPRRVLRVAGDGTPEEVHARVISALAPLLPPADG